MDEHKNDSSDYQNNIMVRYETDAIDTSDCKKDTGFYINIYFAHEYEPLEYAVRTLKDRIANPKIVTLKTDKEQWRIFINYYYDIFEFEYNCETH